MHGEDEPAQHTPARALGEVWDCWCRHHRIPRAARRDWTASRQHVAKGASDGLCLLRARQRGCIILLNEKEHSTLHTLGISIYYDMTHDIISYTATWQSNDLDDICETCVCLYLSACARANEEFVDRFVCYAGAL